MPADPKPTNLSYTSEPASPRSQPVFRPQKVLSLRDRVYEDIRAAILKGSLRPGVRIKERRVSVEMGISTTPVKEALRRLEQEGLIVSRPRQGVVVGPLVLTPVVEVLELRADLEGLAARLTTSKATSEEKEHLRAQTQKTEQLTWAASRVRQTSLVGGLAAFHTLIRLGCGNAFISRFLLTLAPFDRFDCTVHRNAVLSREEWVRDLAAHAAIVDAIFNADEMEAERLMHEHISRVIPQTLDDGSLRPDARNDDAQSGEV
jgi:DNA-binding GntR family transcriptional regulator